jgi:hypothetical protein
LQLKKRRTSGYENDRAFDIDLVKYGKAQVIGKLNIHKD